jgi:hypothetical protein
MAPEAAGVKGKAPVAFRSRRKLKADGKSNIYQPEAYIVVLMFMIASMICWDRGRILRSSQRDCLSSDYVIGVILAGILWGITLGSVDF